MEHAPISDIGFLWETQFCCYLHLAVVMQMEREKRFLFASSSDEFLVPSMVHFIRVYTR